MVLGVQLSTELGCGKRYNTMIGMRLESTRREQEFSINLPLFIPKSIFPVGCGVKKA
jgi:hypothetical protein